MPETPETLGDHIRVARVARGLMQRDLAALFGVTEDSVTNWERNRNTPDITLYPAMFAFLQYYPFTHETDSVNGRFLMWRRCVGLGRHMFAKQYRVDYKTVVKWEETNAVPHGNWPSRINALWQSLPAFLKTKNQNSYATSNSTPQAGRIQLRG